MQWQQKQVEKYCRKYGLVGEQYQLPNATETVVRKNLFRHLLFDDSRKLIFCFIPKVKNCMCTRVCNHIEYQALSNLKWLVCVCVCVCVCACVCVINLTCGYGSGY